MFDIKESLKNLPDKPGVYLHKDARGEIIYVGKAASLKNRVRQYFQLSKNMEPKVRAMVSHIAEFEYITTNNEIEALILENNLIKKLQPLYNVLLRDDKTYPYIKITMFEEYPRLLKTRHLISDGSKYFGPYVDVKSANQVIDLLCNVYALKRCQAPKFPPGHRPCLNYDINRCRGICNGDVNKDEYMDAVRNIIAFLNGKSRDLTDFLQSKMNDAAEALDFETAAIYRDYLQSAESVIEKQKVMLLSGGDMDIVLVSKSEKNSHVVVFFVRDGKLTGRESHHLQAMPEDSPAEIVSAFVKQYYTDQSNIPKELLVDEPLPDNNLIEEWLSGLRGGNVRVFKPQKGDKRALLELAKKDITNVALLLEEKAKTQREKDEFLHAALAEIIPLPERLDKGYGSNLRIEAYDISNISGVDSVGAMVVFTCHRPSRKDYRRFKIKTVEGADDYSSMQEVLYRRMKRFLAGDAGFSTLPDIILLDGGKGHINAASLVLKAMNIQIPLVGMVKDDKHRSRGLIIDDTEIDLRKNPTVYHFIGAVQEEVHRFAIEYHRGIRSKAMVRSELDNIGGIGEKRRNALLSYFGSVENIKSASEDELLRVPGMNRNAVKSLKAYFSD